MKKRLLGFLVLFVMGGATVMAQQPVSGRVTSSVDEAPLPGVSVLVKGTSTGTSTDADGRFTISVPDNNAVLVLSFIGFTTQEITVGNRTTINVEMSEDATELSEVVVTALGIPRETKTLVYATQSVNPASLTEVRDPNNVLNSLQGKIANATITQGSGGVGSGARIVLRGNRSIQRSNNALIVVDGVPINNNTYSAAGSDFGSVQGSDGASNINPDDIESMTVLRGASAAALYGSQAGNGVIVITTKKGAKDRIAVTINSGITTEKAFSLHKLQNEYGQGNSGAYGNPLEGSSWGGKLDGTSYTNYLGETRSYSAQPDNVKDFFRTGLSLNNSIGVSGGSDKMQTYLSYTNNHVEGIVPKNDMNRHTINLRLSNQISKKLSTDAKITYILQDINNRPRTGEENAPVSNIYQIPRNVSIEDARNSEVMNNVGVPAPTPWASTLSSIYQNPYWLINRTAINEKRNRIIGFITAKYNITDWLSLQGRANMDKTIDRGESMYSQGTILYSAPGGSYAKSLIETTQNWFDLMLEGRNSINENLKVEYRVGTILQDDEYTTLYNNATGLNVTNKFSLNFATTRAFEQGGVHTQIQSVFGQVNLALNESVFLDASLRNDWDSRLPPPHSYSYPSIGLSAILSDIIEMPQAFSFVKLMANYAVVGNGGEAQIRFNTYNYSQGAGQGFIQRSPTQAIPDLKPELVKNLEFGLDAKFMENRLGLQLTYYKSNSTNQLLRLNLPVATGFSEQYINAGNIQNQGIELVLHAVPINKANFNWNFDFNLGINRNKIIELGEEVKISYLGGGFGRSATPVVEEGGSYGDLLAFKWMTDAQGRRVVTDAGIPVSSAEQEYIGSFNPKATMGLTNSLNIGKLSLRLLIDGRVGGVIVSGSEMNLAFSGIPEITAEKREGNWNLGGVDLDGNAVDASINAQQFWQTASGKRYGLGEFFAYDATNFRIRELAIGYDIPVPSNFAIRSAKFSVVARNLMFLYRGSSTMDIPGIGKRKMDFDPDMALGNSNYQGVQYFTLPSTQSIGASLMLNF